MLLMSTSSDNLEYTNILTHLLFLSQSLIKQFNEMHFD